MRNIIFDESTVLREYARIANEKGIIKCAQSDALLASRAWDDALARWNSELTNIKNTLTTKMGGTVPNEKQFAFQIKQPKEVSEMLAIFSVPMMSFYKQFQAGLQQKTPERFKQMALTLIDAINNIQVDLANKAKSDKRVGAMFGAEFNKAINGLTSLQKDIMLRSKTLVTDMDKMKAQQGVGVKAPDQKADDEQNAESPLAGFKLDPSAMKGQSQPIGKGLNIQQTQQKGLPQARQTQPMQQAPSAQGPQGIQTQKTQPGQTPRQQAPHLGAYVENWLKQTIQQLGRPPTDQEIDSVAKQYGMTPESVKYLKQRAKSASTKNDFSKQADGKLYDITGETGEQFINDAHPGGGTHTELTVKPKDDGCLVETIVEQQRKDIEVARSVPKGTYAALVSLHNQLNKMGYGKHLGDLRKNIIKIATEEDLIVGPLINLANKLDAMGLEKYANRVDAIVALAIEAGPGEVLEGASWGKALAPKQMELPFGGSKKKVVEQVSKTVSPAAKNVLQKSPGLLSKVPWLTGAGAAAKGVGMAALPWLAGAAGVAAVGIAGYFLYQDLAAAEDTLDGLIDRLGDLDPNAQAEPTINAWINTFTQLKSKMTIPQASPDADTQKQIAQQRAKDLREVANQLKAFHTQWPQIEPNLTDWGLDKSQAKSVLDQTYARIDQLASSAESKLGTVEQAAEKQKQVEKGSGSDVDKKPKQKETKKSNFYPKAVNWSKTFNKYLGEIDPDSAITGIHRMQIDIGDPTSRKAQRVIGPFKKELNFAYGYFKKSGEGWSGLKASLVKDYYDELVKSYPDRKGEFDKILGERGLASPVQKKTPAEKGGDKEASRSKMMDAAIKLLPAGTSTEPRITGAISRYISSASRYFDLTNENSYNRVFNNLQRELRQRGYLA